VQASASSGGKRGRGSWTREIDEAGSRRDHHGLAEEGGGVIRRLHTPGLGERRGTADRFFQEDWLGTTRYLTDSAGQAPSALRFDAYGNETQRQGPRDPTAFQYAGSWGYRRDGDLGLDLLHHRWYDPAVGRFLTRDPIRWAGGLNLYGYCGADPVNGVDPLGLQAWRAVAQYEPVDYELAKRSRAFFDRLGKALGALWEAGGEDVVMLLATKQPSPKLLGRLALTSGKRLFRGRIAGKLTRSQGDRYREEARKLWEKVRGCRASQMGMDVHHRIPLEWSHLLPSADPNRAANLIGLEYSIHRAVNASWRTFRASLKGRQPSAAEVMRHAAKIDETLLMDPRGRVLKGVEFLK
jgi:RHS repeat-associated protein